MSFPFDLHSAAVSDSYLPCHAHAMLRPCRSSQGHSTARPSLDGRAVRRTAWSEHGMANVNQTRPHCVNQTGKTHSKPSAARHDRGTAWARHAICESAFKVFPLPYFYAALAGRWYLLQWSRMLTPEDVPTRR